MIAWKPWPSRGLRRPRLQDAREFHQSSNAGADVEGDAGSSGGSTCRGTKSNQLTQAIAGKSGSIDFQAKMPLSRETLIFESGTGNEQAQMNSQLLKDTAKLLFADHKGLLAMDESNGTCNKRFEKLGIPQTVEARRAYRELIVTTPGLGESIGGAILYDETIRQQKSDGTPFVKVLIEAGITPGIKVDTGAKELAGHPGEKVTEGLDGLRDRLQEYFQMGARFAKWRAVIAIGRAFRVGAALKPMPMPWLAMRRCARRKVLSL